MGLAAVREMVKVEGRRALLAPGNPNEMSQKQVMVFRLVQRYIPASNKGVLHKHFHTYLLGAINFEMRKKRHQLSLASVTTA